MDKGERAYRVYGTNRAYKTYDNKDMPAWNKLSEEIKGAWADVEESLESDFSFKYYVVDETDYLEGSLLSRKEWLVYSLLSCAYNEFVKLPILFQLDQLDFANHVNNLKNILMSRPVLKEISTPVRDNN